MSAYTAATSLPDLVLTPQTELYWLALRMTPGLGARKAVQLLELLRSPEAIFAASPSTLRAEAGLSASVAQSISSGCAMEDALVEQDKVRRLGARVIPFLDPAYPPLLRDIYDPPVLLFALGRTTLLDTAMLAIVGTRRPTPYGMAVTERLATDLAKTGLTIVSGMARGIDTAAHTAALQAEGNTIAVFGSGLDHIYPSENRRLSERIMQKGLLLTEYPSGTPGHPQNFPVRNRIVSGMSVGVLVVEGSQYSGSAITTRLAMDQGREVFAVPGNITSTASWGPNLLIKQGAKLIQGASDVMEELSPELRRRIAAQSPLFGTPVEGQVSSGPPAPAREPEGLMGMAIRAVLRVLKVDAATPLDQLVESLDGFSASEIIAAIFELELTGQIRQLPGKQFVKAISLQ